MHMRFIRIPAACLLFLAFGCSESKRSESGNETATSAKFTALEHSEVVPIRIRTTSGEVQPIPVAKHGLTVVNLFDEFCTECATGERLETLNKLARMQGHDPDIAAVFSETNFTYQDVKNFSLMLKAEYPFYQGKIDDFRNLIIKGRLLIVLDHQGTVIWHEAPDMTQEEVLTHILALKGSDRK